MLESQKKMEVIKDLEKMLPYEELLKYGLDKKDIPWLYEYSKDLHKQSKFEEAKYVLLICLQIDPLNLDMVYFLFFDYVLDSNFDMALYCLIYLMHHTDILKTEYNYYLYLLSLVTTIPSKYQNYLQNLTPANMMVNDVSGKVRVLVYKGKYYAALKNLLEIRDFNLSDKITFKILTTIFDSRKEEYEKIYSLAIEQRYTSILNYLGSNSYNRHHTPLEGTFFHLANVIKDVKKGKGMPLKDYMPSRNINDAIAKNDFDLALKMLQDMPDNASNDTIWKIDHLLLTDLLRAKAQPSPNLLINNPEIYEELESSLKTNNMDLILPALRKYLNFINKRGYENFLINLILIEISEKTNHKRTLFEVKKLQYNKEVNVYKFIKYFYDAIYSNDFKQAELYSNLLLSAKDLVIDGDELTSKIANFMMEVTAIQKNLDTSKLAIIENDYKDIKKFINSLREDVKEKGICIIEFANRLQVKYLKLALKEFPDVYSFRLNEPEDLIRVFKYRNPQKQIVNIREMVSMAEISLQNGEYLEAINYLRQVLDNEENIYYKIYEYLGLAYLKLGNDILGLDYLKVAKFKYQQRTGMNKDYQDLINNNMTLKIQKKN